MEKNSINEVRKPGSTIDDSERLAKIASALASAPELSLSEAIRSIGITDRASLRRLRDKYNREANGAAVIAGRSNSPKSSGKSRQAAMALRASGTAKTKRSPKPNTLETTAHLKIAADRTTGETDKSKTANQNGSRSQSASTASYGMMMPPWISIGLDLSAVAMHTQVQFYEQMMRMSPVSNLVKQQADMFKAMSGFYNVSANTFKPRTKSKAA